MAKGLARQYAKKKIRVNVVSPGTVYFKGGVWNTIEQNMPERYNDAMKRNPTGRMATPQEIASAAVFLASPVSGFTTGSNLVVDGAISNRVNFENALDHSERSRSNPRPSRMTVSIAPRSGCVQ